MKYLTRAEELILLAVFHLGEEACLVTIRRFLKSHTGRPWSVGAVYVPLERLRKKGYLTGFTGGPSARRGRNEIRYYKLSREGFAALADHRRVSEAMWARFSESGYNAGGEG